VGVQAQRVSDGVYKDPYTNKVYDYNEGFTAESGESYPGGSPALQSGLMNLANHLDNKGLIKEADYLDNINKALSKDAGLGAWLGGGGWSGDKPGWGDNPSTLESDQEKAESLRAAAARRADQEELGLNDAGWGQGGSERYEEGQRWLADYDKAQSQGITVDEYRAQGSSGADAASEGGQSASTIDCAWRAMVLEALIRADKDPASPYKLDVGRLDTLSRSGLTPEESSAVEEGGMRRSAGLSRDVNILLKIASGLDTKGDYKAVKIVEDMISAIEV
jgi:hypothetical protein